MPSSSSDERRTTTRTWATTAINLLVETTIRATLGLPPEFRKPFWNRMDEEQLKQALKALHAPPIADQPPAIDTYTNCHTPTALPPFEPPNLSLANKPLLYRA
jgi:hypothetical protein